MDALALLSLQVGWGADEALDDAPIDRRRVAAAVPVAVPAAATVVARPPPIPKAAAVTVVGATANAAAAAAAARDLPALIAAIAAFTGCALRDTATSTVLPTGELGLSPRIVVVGEVPDEAEDRAGTPFAGRPGQLLDQMLGSIGLDRSQLLLVPLIPWRPPGNRPPSPLELAICLPFLHRALVLAAPTHLLLMGSRPARIVADTTIRADGGFRRPVLDGLGDQANALAMRHPSYLLSHLPSRRDAWNALLRLRKVLDVAAKPAEPITES